MGDGAVMGERSESRACGVTPQADLWDDGATRGVSPRPLALNACVVAVWVAWAAWAVVILFLLTWW